MTTTRMSRRALSEPPRFRPRAAAAREYSGYRVVTPRVPPWRAGDDAVTALVVAKAPATRAARVVGVRAIER